ncbi:MAG TPA: BamA/TamA family outer membrane protein [Vicinamibacterales bacterium]|nr:BamA/TamA family outer membrane protein [Vicinamibacterales bacterium]
MSLSLWSGIAAVVLALGFAVPARAQTRQAIIAQEQEEKARNAVPETPGRVEIFFQEVEEGQWFLGIPRGWYPIFGSIYPGGGLAAGAGYRHHIGYDSYVDVSAMYSLGNYKRAAIVGNTPNHAKGRLDLSGSISWLDATQVPFHGLGNDSDRDRRSSFRISRTQVEGSAVLHLVEWLRLRLDGGIDDYAQKPGQGRFPSIETLFSADSAPLLGTDETYLRGEASAAIHWLQSPGYSRKGGLYRLAYEEFNPLRGEGRTFGFVRTEVVQHLPILRETWVVSLRARTESIVRKSDVVPYFLMPWLGSGNTLRGYTTGRFRDRHALLLTGELRWFPNRAALDMAIFVDAGKVAPDRGGLTFSGMKTDYGVGVRFHTPAMTILRAELAHGLEGWRTIFAASAPF